MPKIQKKTKSNNVLKFSFTKTLSQAGNENLMLINSHTLLDPYTLYVGITPHKLVKSDFCEFILHSGRHLVSTVLKSYFKTKFIRDKTRGWIEGQF